MCVSHCPTSTLVFSAPMWTCRSAICVVLPASMTHFGNVNASHYIFDSHWWSMIKLWISNACYTKQGSGVFNISSSMMRCGSRRKDGVAMVLEIVSKVGRQWKCRYWLGGFSWFSDIILDAIQLADNLLTIIEVPWFVDWALKFIT
jgi:hypothetical protein